MTSFSRHFPKIYCVLIEDLYRYSSFSVLCGCRLSRIFFIVRGTKTGDPLSALLFILVIDRICRPMVNVALINRNLEDERRVTPLPVQAFADDIVASADSLSTLERMIAAGEPRMQEAGLDIKVTKCACFYGRRSGNNWYTGKRDIVPVVTIQANPLRTYLRKEPYKYLGKSLSLLGEDK